MLKMLPPPEQHIIDAYKLANLSPIAIGIVGETDKVQEWKYFWSMTVPKTGELIGLDDVSLVVLSVNYSTIPGNPDQMILAPSLIVRKV
jgi:hypothetical protein